MIDTIYNLLKWVPAVLWIVSAIAFLLDGELAHAGLAGGLVLCWAMIFKMDEVRNNGD